ncbi:MAG: hypothetical protein LBT79_00975 [Elusimicrobiota bacterium]|jgi:DNA-binding phage protein|nr:hypothetical protein [Elusimicrobiota bacterium]
MKKRKTMEMDFKLTPADVETIGEDYTTYYAKYLKENPAQLKSYKKHIIKEYNKTKDMPLFLEGLKIVAQAEHKATKFAKVSKKVDRTSVYKILSKEENPTIYNLLTAANNLGIGFNAYATR